MKLPQRLNNDSFRFIPIVENDKFPTRESQKWQKLASSAHLTFSEAENNLEMNPKINIAIMNGTGKLCTVDIDNKEEGKKSFQEFEARTKTFLPKTLKQGTPHDGLRLYFI